jgi:hypothetical protein
MKSMRVLAAITFCGALAFVGGCGKDSGKPGAGGKKSGPSILAAAGDKADVAIYINPKSIKNAELVKWATGQFAPEFKDKALTSLLPPNVTSLLKGVTEKNIDGVLFSLKVPDNPNPAQLAEMEPCFGFSLNKAISAADAKKLFVELDKSDEGKDKSSVNSVSDKLHFVGIVGPNDSSKGAASRAKAGKGMAKALAAVHKSLPADANFWVVARSTSAMTKAIKESPASGLAPQLLGMKNVALGITITDGIKLTISLEVADAEAATALQKVAEGLVATMVPPEQKDTVKNLKISAKGATVTASISVDGATVKKTVTPLARMFGGGPPPANE